MTHIKHHEERWKYFFYLESGEENVIETVQHGYHHHLEHGYYHHPQHGYHHELEFGSHAPGINWTQLGRCPANEGSVAQHHFDMIL